MRQGCVLSPLLFVIIVEFLAIKIRACTNITGLLNEVTPNFDGIKLIQYADDLSLFLKTEESLSKALKIIDDFNTVTGLSLNRRKSVAMCLGNLKHDGKCSEGLRWLKEDDNMKILGIFFNAKRESSLIKENWE